MLRKLNTKPAGFTLVEIMIVVAIIALLAAIAVPNFMRSRKRAQATHILEDLRIIDAAIDQYAMETNRTEASRISWDDVRGYIKKGTRLYTANAVDMLGNYFLGGVISESVKVSRASYEALSDVAPLGFWSPYGVEP